MDRNCDFITFTLKYLSADIIKNAKTQKKLKELKIMY